jgi:hypothetical protein
MGAHSRQVGCMSDANNRGVYKGMGALNECETRLWGAPPNCSAWLHTADLPQLQGQLLLMW